MDGSTQRRRFFRFVAWTLRRADDEPDLPPVQHQFRCLGEGEDGTLCDAEGPVSLDFEEAQRWPFKHIREQQEHRSYSHIAVVPWLMVPAKEPNSAFRADHGGNDPAHRRDDGCNDHSPSADPRR